MREKIEKVLLGLEKIARETGEDEYELIYLLASEKGIIITNEISSFLFYSHVAIWLLKPFTNEKFDAIKSTLNSQFPSGLIDKILQRIEKYNNFYLRYPETIQIYKIDEEIFEFLTEEHGIDCNEINEAEWEEIKKTDIWKSSVNQTAREMVALKITRLENLVK